MASNVMKNVKNANMKDTKKPELVWGLIEARTVESDLPPEQQQTVEVIRARVHQGWLVRTTVYIGDDKITQCNQTYVPDPNGQWDGRSHLDVSAEG